MKKLILFIVTILFSACSSNKEQQPISFEIDKIKSAMVVDVREREELADGVIRDAYWYPLSELDQMNESVLDDLKAKANGKDIYIYCRSGVRAQKFKDFLKNYGIGSRNIGGFNALVSGGLEPLKIDSTQVEVRSKMNQD